MQDSFYPDALRSYGIEVLMPDENDQEYVNQVIYGELINGTILDQSRVGYLKVIQRLVGKGSEGMILGCTEIPLLIRSEDEDLPLFDTTDIHTDAALKVVLM